MITPPFFDKLSKRQKAEVLQSEGIYMYTRQEPQFIVDLYFMTDFYVEVFYHKVDDNFIIVRSFYAEDQTPAAMPENNIDYPLGQSYLQQVKGAL